MWQAPVAANSKSEGSFDMGPGFTLTFKCCRAVITGVGSQLTPTG